MSIQTNKKFIDNEKEIVDKKEGRIEIENSEDSNTETSMAPPISNTFFVKK